MEAPTGGTGIGATFGSYPRRMGATTAPAETPPEVTSPGVAGARMLGGGAVAAAVVPFLIPVITLFVQRPVIFMDGDQAVDELAVMRAEHFAQLVGNYSRSPGVSAADAWSHPGPAWFYTMDPVYALSGSTSWGFAAAAILLHGIAAALIVGVAWRRGGPWLAVVTSALLLLFVAVAGPGVFLPVWPPFATILPFALLLLLAALGAAGSTPALVASWVAASYLMQVHVATVAVAGVTVVAATFLWVALAVLRQRRRSTAQPAASGEPGRPVSVGGRFATAAASLVLVVMWIPPVVDEVTSHPGNLTKLVTYFGTPQGSHPLSAALSAIARQLESLPLGRFPATLVDDSGSLPLVRLATWLGFLVVASLLAWLGYRLRDRFAGAVGLLCFLAVAIATLSLTHADGPLYPYFVDWASTLPVVLLIGWVALAITVLRRRSGAAGSLRVSRPLAVGIAIILGLAVVGLASADAVTLTSDLRPAVETSNDPGTPAAWRVTQSALSAYHPQGIDVVIAQSDRWTLAAGLIDQLEKRGWRVAVPSSWLFMFGNGAKELGSERLELVVEDAGAPPPRAQGARMIGHALGTELYLAPLAAAGSLSSMR
jgi:hypothetical protein